MTLLRHFRSMTIILFTLMMVLGTSAQNVANVIAFETTEFGTLTASAPIELWQFEGYAADLVAVSMKQVMSQLDSYLVIRDPMGRVIATDDNSGGGAMRSSITCVCQSQAPIRLLHKHAAIPLAIMNLGSIALKWG